MFGGATCLIFVGIEPLVNLVNVNGPLDDLVIVGQFPPGGQFHERLTENASFGIHVLHDGLHDLIHFALGSRTGGRDFQSSSELAI